MRLFNKWRRAAACLLALGLVSAAFVRTGRAQFGVNYAVTDLGTLGGLNSRAYGINNSGRVVGDSTAAAGTTTANGSVWTSTTPAGVGTFGGDGSGVYALNSIGYAVGYAATQSDDQHAFIWSDIFNKLDLGTLPGGSFATAFDINDANQVVGQSEVGVLQDRGFVWQKSTGMQAIQSFNGTGSTGANGINNAGQIVGWAATASGPAHAFLLSGGVMTDLGTLGGANSIAYKVSESGTVVGYSETPSANANRPFHAFRWTALTGMADLGALAGGRSIAYDINSAGLIVGYSEVAPGVPHAFVYNDLSGMQDLNNISLTPGWTLQEARSINDKGQIVGYGISPSGQVHAFLLDPQSDEIPGGEPPPCFVDPNAHPIILPQFTTPLTAEPVRKPATKVRGR